MKGRQTALSTEVRVAEWTGNAIAGVFGENGLATVLVRTPAGGSVSLQGLLGEEIEVLGVVCWLENGLQLVVLGLHSTARIGADHLLGGHLARVNFGEEVMDEALLAVLVSAAHQSIGVRKRVDVKADWAVELLLLISGQCRICQQPTGGLGR